MPQYQTGVALFLLGFIVIAMICIKGRTDRLPYLSFMCVYLVFHFGILPAEIIRPGVLLEKGSTYRWYHGGQFVRESLNIALVFFIGYILALFTPEPKIYLDMPMQDILPRRKQHFDRFFVLLLSFICGAWATIVLVVLGITNYVLYNELARGSNSSVYRSLLVYLYPLIGLILLIGLLYSRKVGPLFAVFGVWGTAAFIIGLRGEVLFPLAMSIPILMIQGRIRFRPVIFVFSLVLILTLSSFVKDFRNSASPSDALENISVLNGLSELGGSLRPVYETVRWTNTGMMEWQYGASYYAPFERTFFGLFPLIERVSAREDLRLMNVAIFQLTNGGSYGFSIAAEAYINFGLIGTFSIGLFVGMVMLRFGRKALCGVPSILLIAVVYALYYHIRQSFVGAFGSFVVIFVAGIVVTRTINRKSSKSVRSEALQKR